MWSENVQKKSYINCNKLYNIFTNSRHNFLIVAFGKNSSRVHYLYVTTTNRSNLMDWLSIGQNIKEKRLAKSWKQSTLAERVDLTTSYVGMIERGEKIPKLETFINITNALDSTSDEILEGVLNRGYEIRMSEYITRIQNLPKKDQDEIFEVLDVMLKHRHKK